MPTTQLIIHSGTGGLPHADGYYKVFPQEPSPAGLMQINPNKIVKLDDMTMLDLLDAMAKVGAGGIVLIVCHAEKNGMRVRLATGGTHATRDALDVILNAEAAFRRATVIRAQPEKTPKERQDKLNEWQALSERLKGFSVLGKDLRQSSEAFDFWFAGEARRLRLTTANLRLLFAKAAVVRKLRLSRVELRACDIGGSPDSMKVLKKFFGCNSLFAPRCRTIYLAPMTVESIAPLQVHPADHRRSPRGKLVNELPGGAHRLRGGPWHAHRVPGPGGKAPPFIPIAGTDDISFNGKLVPGRKREFFNGRSYLAISIWEIDDFVFRGSVAAPRPSISQKRGPARTSWIQRPDWTQVGEVVRSMFMFSGGNYGGKTFPFAGLWNPPASIFPWLVPNEKDYALMIVQV